MLARTRRIVGTRWGSRHTRSLPPPASTWGRWARPFLTELMELSRESSNLAALEKNSVVYLDICRAPAGTAGPAAQVLAGGGRERVCLDPQRVPTILRVLASIARRIRVESNR